MINKNPHPSVSGDTDDVNVFLMGRNTEYFDERNHWCCWHEKVTEWRSKFYVKLVAENMQTKFIYTIIHRNVLM